MSRPEISTDMEKLNNTVIQLDLTDIRRARRPPTGEFTFFPKNPGTFTKVYNILGEKTNIY